MRPRLLTDGREGVALAGYKRSFGWASVSPDLRFVLGGGGGGGGGRVDFIRVHHTIRSSPV